MPKSIAPPLGPRRLPSTFPTLLLCDLAVLVSKNQAYATDGTESGSCYTYPVPWIEMDSSRSRAFKSVDSPGRCRQSLPTRPSTQWYQLVRQERPFEPFVSPWAQHSDWRLEVAIFFLFLFSALSRLACVQAHHLAPFLQYARFSWPWGS